MGWPRLKDSMLTYDTWRTRCPEHEEAEDYRDVVGRFVRGHATEIDDALDALADLDRDAREQGITDFGDAANVIADLIEMYMWPFKRTDRINGKRANG